RRHSREDLGPDVAVYDHLMNPQAKTLLHAELYLDSVTRCRPFHPGGLSMSDTDIAALPAGELINHLDLFDPAHQERLWEVLHYARESACPVIKTDADQGYFIIARYDD